MFFTISKFLVNILGNDFDKCRLLHAFKFFNLNILAIINAGSGKLCQCQLASGCRGFSLAPCSMVNVAYIV